MIEERISHESNGKVFITLLRRAEAEGALWEWFVQISDDTGSVDEDFLDQHQARAFYRTVCAENGIQVGYQAPTFAIDVSVEPSVAMTAAQYYHEYRAWLSSLRAGSDEVIALRDKLMADPAFIRLAPEIESLAESTEGWIGAVIRTTCRRITIRQKAEEAAESLRLSAEVEGFGDF